MAKRFTATEKWDDPWFSVLEAKDQLFWIYLLDKCSHAGIWQVNWPLVKFHIKGFRFNAETFKGRILEINPQKWFIPKFIEFQYGELNSANRAHSSVLFALEKEGASKDLISPIQGAKDKDKDMDKDKDKVKDKDFVSKSEKELHLEFVRLLPAEYEKLSKLMGPQTQAFIERLNGYIGQIGVGKASSKYTSHYHTILNWYRKDLAEGKVYGTNDKQAFTDYKALARAAREAKKVREISYPRALPDGPRNHEDVHAGAGDDITGADVSHGRTLEAIRQADSLEDEPNRRTEA